jgi:hypothetical protein
MCVLNGGQSLGWTRQTLCSRDCFLFLSSSSPSLPVLSPVLVRRSPFYSPPFVQCNAHVHQCTLGGGDSGFVRKARRSGRCCFSLLRFTLSSLSCDHDDGLPAAV